MAKAGLEGFVCKRCQACCRQAGFVYLSQEEAGGAAQFLGMNEFDFINEYCELQDRSRLVLKKLAEEVCVFLQQDGCRIHPVKPRQCLDFPLQWRTPRSFDYCEGLKSIQGNL
ncbi:YkgJ family cysteine cluster protein [Omnitrophica bacterium]|nr:YkgJ family cysteine cluster protein [Candidatus Omnitrophota bacterium]